MMHYYGRELLQLFVVALLITDVQPAAVYLSEKVNPKSSQRILRLGNTFRDLPSNTVVIVDG
jgi:hypothetical protein